MINSGLPLVLATDYNPGSAPSGNMNLAVSLICINLKIGSKLMVLMSWIMNIKLAQ